MRSICGALQNHAGRHRVSSMRILFTALSLISLGVMIACSKSSEQQKTSELQPTPITSYSPAPSFPALAQSSPGQPNENAPPKTDEVADAVARVFDNSIKLDQTQGTAFLVGDFNGDGSQDIAVITRASDDSVAQLNSELANWTL